MEHLPTCRAEMERRGWAELDILFLTGDAYIDHPSFGVALLSRYLESHGFRTGIIAQPDWTSPEALRVMGRPRLFCAISGGALDSMLAHYTAFRKKRHEDAYTPGGRSGGRPNRAVTVYANLARQVFPGLPLIIGGIEASLRRAAHYDFWSESLRRSILQESRADILVYGMGELALLTLARRIQANESLSGVKGTALLLGSKEVLPSLVIEIPSYEEIVESPGLLMAATLAIEEQVQRGTGRLMQRQGKQALLIEPPAPPLTTEELDALYALPYTREAHPAGIAPLPALAMIAESITALRGCGGGCSFCSLAVHQGRRVQSRSRESILQEITELCRGQHRAVKISDIGGPTANAWMSRCTQDPSVCRRKSCYAPSLCPGLQLEQEGYLSLLHAAAALTGVSGVRVGSGIRHDLMLNEPDVIKDLAENFVGGQLKLAPEHCAEELLTLMRKPSFSSFEEFLGEFAAASDLAGKEQYVIPYVMSAFPGCTMENMRSLKAWFEARRWRPQQIQCFIPTPGTVATAMYYGECDMLGNHIYVARTDRERTDQHAILTSAFGSGTVKEKRR